MEREGITREIFMKASTTKQKKARIQSSYRYEEIFCYPTSVGRSYNLKRCLYQLGLVHPNCAWCWRDEGKDGVKLQVDHINGNSTDNQLENLRILCPNCHSLTNTYRGRNGAKTRRNAKKYIYKGPLTKDSGDIHNNPTVRNRLIILEGWENCCSLCNATPSESIIELDHINGDHRDNRIENLRLLCLNCHSCTETYCRISSMNLKKFCHDCGKECKGFRCKKCHHISMRTSLRNRRKRGECTVCGKDIGSYKGKLCDECYSNRAERLLRESYHECLVSELFTALPFPTDL